MSRAGHLTPKYCLGLRCACALQLGLSGADKHCRRNLTTVTPAGEDWIADVLCTKGKEGVTFEVQLSQQTREERDARNTK